MGMILEVNQLACGYRNKIVNEHINFSIEEGEVMCILGANGIGKTTLFKSLLGHLKILEGEVLLEGEDIFSLAQKTIAQKVGYVPQAHVPPFPYTVLEVVMMGRCAHLSLFSAPSKKDRKLAKNILKSLEISYLESEIYTEISGGERQLVLIARALAQQPKLLIMDEPTANLDFGNQMKILNKVKELAKEGLSIVMTTHFPEHAFLCAKQVLVLKKNKEYEQGEPKEIITPVLLKEIYGIDVEIKDVEIKNGHQRKCILVEEECL